jgi:phosphate butyryltransferase
VALPGPGTILLDQSLRFTRPVGIGDTVAVTVTVKQKQPDKGFVALDCSCVNQKGEVVLTGEALVKPPREKVRRPRAALPEIRVAEHARYRRLLELAGAGRPVVTAVAHPCDAAAVQGAVRAAAAGLIEPVLVGPEAKIRAAAEEAGDDISPFRLVTAPHSHAAAAQAVALVRSGEAELLMKGSLHTDELMSAVVSPETGLRTERRISHVYLMDVPSYPRALLITDAAVNITPDLEAKRDIVQNAIDLALVLGIATPKVAILSAVETVSRKICSTLDAAALCKMADRGQITGGLLDGPLAFDNAVSPEAAREKGIVSAVAGQADILIAPDLEAGNMLAKQLSFLAGADAAGVVLGARVPIILTSRADCERTRIASCAVAVLMARARTAAAPGGPQPAE